MTLYKAIQAKVPTSLCLQKQIPGLGYKHTESDKVEKVCERSTTSCVNAQILTNCNNLLKKA